MPSNMNSLIFIIMLFVDLESFSNYESNTLHVAVGLLFGFVS